MPLGTSLRLQTPLRGCPLARETKVQTREAERCPRSRGAGDLAWAQNHTPSAGGHGGHGCRSGSHLEPWDPRWGLKTLSGTTAPAPITLLPSRAAGWVLGTPGLVAELGKQRTPRKQAQTRGPRQPNPDAAPAGAPARTSSPEPRAMAGVDHGSEPEWSGPPGQDRPGAFWSPVLSPQGLWGAVPELRLQCLPSHPRQLRLALGLQLRLALASAPTP